MITKLIVSTLSALTILNNYDRVIVKPPFIDDNLVLLESKSNKTDNYTDRTLELEISTYGVRENPNSPITSYKYACTTTIDIPTAPNIRGEAVIVTAPVGEGISNVIIENPPYQTYVVETLVNYDKKESRIKDGKVVDEIIERKTISYTNQNKNGYLFPYSIINIPQDYMRIHDRRDKTEIKYSNFSISTTVYFTSAQKTLKQAATLFVQEETKYGIDINNISVSVGYQSVSFGIGANIGKRKYSEFYIVATETNYS